MVDRDDLLNPMGGGARMANRAGGGGFSGGGWGGSVPKTPSPWAPPLSWDFHSKDSRGPPNFPPLRRSIPDVVRLLQVMTIVIPKIPWLTHKLCKSSSICERRGQKNRL